MSGGSPCAEDLRDTDQRPLIAPGERPTIGMSGKDRAPRSCGDVDVELRRLTS